MTFKTSDGGSVSAHRAIVAAGSPVFHAMLYGNMKESSQKEIELLSIDSNVLKKMLSFIYSGQVKANLMDFLELLRAADYFDINELKTKCLDTIEREIVSSFKCNNLICRNITVYAVTHQIDSLVESCIRLMEYRADSIVQSSWISSLPLSSVLAIILESSDSRLGARMLLLMVNNAGVVQSLWFCYLPFPIPTIFVKSSDLEVRELDLFLVVVDWCKQQKDTISDDDVKSLFRQIRYPLIQKNDLVEKVHPTSMADPDLYKAAIEYHDSDKFDGPEDQLKLRKFYFNFCNYVRVDDLKIEHTAKGTVIKNDGPNDSAICVAKVLFRDTINISFTFCVDFCQDKSKKTIMLFEPNPMRERWATFVDLPIGEKIQGIISCGIDGIVLKIGDAIKLQLYPYCCEECRFGIQLFKGDQVHILRT